MNKKVYYAHSANDSGSWHQLVDHLRNTARIAASFGRNKFERDIFRYTGLIHDAGKYTSEFQDYLINGGTRGSVPHAIFGAVIAAQAKNNPVAFAVHGHHRGLQDVGPLINDVKSTVADEKLVGQKNLLAKSGVGSCPSL